jgi:hypothetical protein
MVQLRKKVAYFHKIKVAYLLKKLHDYAKNAFKKYLYNNLTKPFSTVCRQTPNFFHFFQKKIQKKLRENADLERSVAICECF